MQWWSLQPLQTNVLPALRNDPWARSILDLFVLEKLREKGLKPSAEATPPQLVRRLSLLLTGLPPSPAAIDSFSKDGSPGAFARLVDSFLESPHFGERWARHWMDLVHYSDTHGYEWDTPAKNAWIYRDYLVRAFNQNLPVNRLIEEHIAGDLLNPRLDGSGRVNESLIGPMGLRLGERRHGDNAAAEGVTQEAVANVIDTVSKAFLATTVACAQCHDHKLDAISQRDYYAMAGMFMNSRWISRTVDAVNPNSGLINQLKEKKKAIRKELASEWKEATGNFEDRVSKLAKDEKSTNQFPASIRAWWTRSQANPITADQFHAEVLRRRVENRDHLKLVADFSNSAPASGWSWAGMGMETGLAKSGDFAVADNGSKVILHLLPAGRWSHLWSQRLAGAVRSPLLPKKQSPAPAYSIGLAASSHAARAFVIDHALHSERMAFIQQPNPGWLTLKAGDFDTLEGGIDQLERRVYLEISTKALNNYWPPRTGYGGMKESDQLDPRSWFGITRIWEHPTGKPPQDELQRFAPLFETSGSWQSRIAACIGKSVGNWCAGNATDEDVLLLNDAIQCGILPNDQHVSPRLKLLVEDYRSLESALIPDTTVGSLADMNEGEDERLAMRGVYTDLGETVPRGGIELLGGPGLRRLARSSGRLEFATNLVNPARPLAARVFVNRIWHYLWGHGIVRTTDDFGHLGETPSHPELLDHLAQKFIQEGWSLKSLIRYIVTSSAWRQGGAPDGRAIDLDPENRLFHHFPMLRLDAESIRDSMLAVSGRLVPSLGGPPVDPPRAAEDPAKRLQKGPVDGLGRRSIYTKITLMEPPRFMALFNQPIPKLTTGRRDVTGVPDQALALLNDPLVIQLAADWGDFVLKDQARSPEERISAMFSRAFSREPEPAELHRLLGLANAVASSRGLTEGDFMRSKAVWKDVAHAIFNLKEFIHVF